MVRRRRRRDRPSARRRDGPALERARHKPRPRRRSRAAHPLLLPLGAVQGPGRRGARRGQLDAGRVHAAARARGNTAARGGERLRLARRVGGSARQELQRQHPGVGVRDRRAARVRGEGRRLMSAPADGVFAALADPTRWRVLSLLAERGEGTATSLAGELPVSRVAVVKHLAVLDRAGLVEARREGREVRYTVCTEPLGETARWMTGLASQWDARLAALKRIAEEEELQP